MINHNAVTRGLLAIAWATFADVITKRRLTNILDLDLM
jgi:hypothetical protein